MFKQNRVDACVGDQLETEDAMVGTEPLVTFEAETCTEMEVLDEFTETLGLLSVEDKQTLTVAEKPPVKLHHAFIFPMMR